MHLIIGLSPDSQGSDLVGTVTVRLGVGGQIGHALREARRAPSSSWVPTSEPQIASISAGSVPTRASLSRLPPPRGPIGSGTATPGGNS